MLQDRLSSRQILVFCLTYAAYATLYSTRKPFSVVKAHIQNELGVSTHVLGWIDTLFLGAYAFGQILIPPLTDGMGSTRKLLLACYVGSFLSAILFGAASSSSLMAVAWFLNGLFHSAVYPFLVRSLSPWFSSAVRGRVMGAWTTSQQTGAIASTAFASFVAELIGWRWAFFLPGVAVGVIGVALHLGPLDAAPARQSSGTKQQTTPPTSPKNEHDVLRGHARNFEPPGRSSPSEDVKVAADSNGPAEFPSTSSTETDVPITSTDAADFIGKFHHRLDTTWRKTRATLQIAGLKDVAIAYFCVKCVRYSLLFWLPFYVSRELGFDTGVAGFTSMAYDVGGIFGALVTGVVSDGVLKGRRLAAAAASTLLAAVSLLIFSSASRHGLQPLVLSMFLTGMAIAGPDSVLGAAAAQDLCDHSNQGAYLGTAAGFVNGMGSTGAVLQGFITTSIALQHGWRSLFAVQSVLLMFGFVFLFRPVSIEHASLSAQSGARVRKELELGKVGAPPAESSAGITRTDV